ncbi:hypothetical protein HPB47_001031 [Ixodes persulcatus]|uniref:Uncharacterized protein n=1 Tax=Ixodes persulcatus TaxID=34615 RepID=A0AC60PQ64_IXOPE|nr:hypothetical protein HPB47_001031 [Ixodes persulcatus]
MADLEGAEVGHLNFRPTGLHFRFRKEPGQGFPSSFPSQHAHAKYTRRSAVHASFGPVPGGGEGEASSPRPRDERRFNDPSAARGRAPGPRFAGIDPGTPPDAFVHPDSTLKATRPLDQ